MIRDRMGELVILGCPINCGFVLLYFRVHGRCRSRERVRDFFHGQRPAVDALTRLVQQTSRVAIRCAWSVARGDVQCVLSSHQLPT